MDTYYATTTTQTRSRIETIVCSVVVPSTLSIFRQRLIALRLAKHNHPDSGIIGVIERRKLSASVQIAVAKLRPTYAWSDNEHAS